ncbi:MAG TPA: dienelactone hydrolase family protein [Roseiflexaceae bacterium]|nr:dienelactone hydrolase family protein [Roseiflexaceae bacterium]
MVKFAAGARNVSGHLATPASGSGPGVIVLHAWWGAGAQSVQVLEMRLRSAGHATTFYTYPTTRHWFAEDDRLDAYNAEAVQLAWERSIKFLRSHLR